MLKYLAAFAVCLSTTAMAQDSTVTEQMPFDACVTNMQSTPAAIQPPTMTVDSETMKQVQFPVIDGMMTITCDAMTGQSTLTHQKQ